MVNKICTRTNARNLFRSQNVWALKYVHEQTREICLAAVNQDGRALYFVYQQTPEICLASKTVVLLDLYANKQQKFVSTINNLVNK